MYWLSALLAIVLIARAPGCRAAVVCVMNQQDTRDLLALRLVPSAVSASPEQFNAYVQSEVKRWSKIINDNNVKLE
jgi:tripartite-type tricarboxylate transporter receptor subunit TctC